MLWLSSYYYCNSKVYVLCTQTKMSRETKVQETSEICYHRQDHCHTISAMQKQQFYPKIVGETPMKALKNRLDKSCPNWFRYSWSCLKIRKRVTQPLEKPFSTPFTGGPVITYRKEEYHIPTYLSVHCPSFSPKLQDVSPALGLITEQLRPSQKRPTLKMCHL